MTEQLSIHLCIVTSEPTKVAAITMSIDFRNWPSHSWMSRETPIEYAVEKLRKNPKSPNTIHKVCVRLIIFIYCLCVKSMREVKKKENIMTKCMEWLKSKTLKKEKCIETQPNWTCNLFVQESPSRHVVLVRFPSNDHYQIIVNVVDHQLRRPLYKIALTVDVEDDDSDDINMHRLRRSYYLFLFFLIRRVPTENRELKKKK